VVHGVEMVDGMDDVWWEGDVMLVNVFEDLLEGILDVGWRGSMVMGVVILVLMGFFLEVLEGFLDIIWNMTALVLVMMLHSVVQMFQEFFMGWRAVMHGMEMVEGMDDVFGEGDIVVMDVFHDLLEGILDVGWWVTVVMGVVVLVLVNFFLEVLEGFLDIIWHMSALVLVMVLHSLVQMFQDFLVRRWAVMEEMLDCLNDVGRDGDVVLVAMFLDFLECFLDVCWRCSAWVEFVSMLLDVLDCLLNIWWQVFELVSMLVLESLGDMVQEHRLESKSLQAQDCFDDVWWDLFVVLVTMFLDVLDDFLNIVGGRR
jgi:hypothetical protein